MERRKPGNDLRRLARKGRVCFLEVGDLVLDGVDAVYPGCLRRLLSCGSLSGLLDFSLCLRCSLPGLLLCLGFNFRRILTSLLGFLRFLDRFLAHCDDRCHCATSVRGLLMCSVILHIVNDPCNLKTCVSEGVYTRTTEYSQVQRLDTQPL